MLEDLNKITRKTFFDSCPTQSEVMSTWLPADRPILSIICLTYNQIAYLPAAVFSFLIQRTEYPFEILINDDASSDGTAEFLRELAHHYSLIVKININSENFHSAGKKNLPHMLAMSSADLLAFCDGDDYWTSNDKIQKQVALMQNSAGCLFSFHAHTRIHAVSGEVIGTIRPANVKEYYDLHDFVSHIGCLNQTATSIFRKEVYTSLPDWAWNAPYLDFFVSCLAANDMQTRGCEGALYIDESMSVYRRHVEGSWTSTPIRLLLKRKNLLFSALDRLAKSLPKQSYSAIVHQKNVRLYEYARKCVEAGCYSEALKLNLVLLRNRKIRSFFKIFYFILFRRALDRSMAQFRSK